MSTEVHADRLIAALRGALGARLVTFHNSLLSEVRPTTGDLILGFAFGYPPEVLSPFVESVRSDGKFDGKIVLFVNSSSQEVIEYLKEREIEPFAFDPSKSLMPSIFLARFFTYYEYLRDQWANGNVFNQILLTDVRDVIFQKRLFGTACDTLEFHLEEAFPTIQECPNNSKWMKHVFGKEALSAFATKTISLRRNSMRENDRHIGLLNSSAVASPPIARKGPSTVWHRPVHPQLYPLSWPYASSHCEAKFHARRDVV